MIARHACASRGSTRLPMASTLQRKGFGLRVFDLDRARVDTVVPLGARSAGSITQAAPEVVVTMLPATLLVERVAFVVRPVGQLVALAGRSESIFRTGAQDATVARIEPQMSAMSVANDCCERPGMNTCMKIVNNRSRMSILPINAEGMTLGTKLKLGVFRHGYHDGRHSDNRLALQAIVANTRDHDGRGDRDRIRTSQGVSLRRRERH